MSKASARQSVCVCLSSWNARETKPRKQCTQPKKVSHSKKRKELIKKEKKHTNKRNKVNGEMYPYLTALTSPFTLFLPLAHCSHSLTRALAHSLSLSHVSFLLRHPPTLWIFFSTFFTRKTACLLSNVQWANCKKGWRGCCIREECGGTTFLPGGGMAKMLNVCVGGDKVRWWFRMFWFRMFCPVSGLGVIRCAGEGPTP